ncbi:MAG: mycothiol system anti-sigma-R factor [Mycobacteriales bacterium]
MSEHCERIIEQVYLYLDGELGDSDITFIRTHLEECGPCLREYGIEEEFKRLVARKCTCEQAPEELRAKVLSRLRTAQINISHLEYRAD